MKKNDYNYCPYCRIDYLKEEVAADAVDCDNKNGPVGYWCTREMGHEGNHVACARTYHLLDVWENGENWHLK